MCHHIFKNKKEKRKENSMHDYVDLALLGHQETAACVYVSFCCHFSNIFSWIYKILDIFKMWVMNIKTILITDYCKNLWGLFALWSFLTYLNIWYHDTEKVIMYKHICYKKCRTYSFPLACGWTVTSHLSHPSISFSPLCFISRSVCFQCISGHQWIHSTSHSTSL